MKYLRKTSILLFLLVSVQLSFAIGINDEIGTKFNKIINELDSLINNAIEQNEIVYQRYKFVIDKIYKNELSVAFDSTFDFSFRGCAATKILNDSINVELTIGNYIIEIYDKHPSIVYSILIFQFQHIFEFYHNRNSFLISIDNTIEELYYNIDALMVEAMFIKHYLSDNSDLPPVENYLVYDIDNNMTGSSILFYKTDLTLLHRMDDLRNEKNIKKALKGFNLIGEDLNQSVKFEGSKWENYISLVSLNTYVYFSSQILHDINYKLGNDSIEFDLDKYPETKEIIKKIKRTANDNIDYFNYYDETMKKFENAYLN